MKSLASQELLKVVHTVSFEATFHDRLNVIVRLPYPSTIPRDYGIISEVATMEYLRLHGVPIPKVFDWISSTDNPVQSEYIIMEKVQGKGLEHTWYTMTAKERMAVVEKIVDIERTLFAIRFLPVAAYTSKTPWVPELIQLTCPWLSIVSKRIGFALGLPLNFFGGIKRDELAVNRGPCKRPILPFALDQLEGCRVNAQGAG